MRRIYRTIFSPFARRTPKLPVIFMYHRVARLQYDPWGLAVDPERFDAQMHWLASERLVLPLHDFVERLGAGDLPNDSAAITFDDGYVDNLNNALPAIWRHGLCATVFVVGGAIGRSEGFWWDELVGLILGSRSKLDASVTIGNQTILLKWPAGSNRPGEGPLWRAWMRPSHAREMAYVTAWQALRNASSEARLKGMRELRMLLPPVDMERDRAMNVRELRELTTGATFTLGGHTMTHAALPTLANDRLREELADSLAACRSVSPLIDSASHTLMATSTTAFTARSSLAASLGPAPPDLTLWIAAGLIYLPSRAWPWEIGNRSGLRLFSKPAATGAID